MRFSILGLLLGGTLSAVEVGEVIWEFDIKRDFYEKQSSPAIGSDGTVYFGAHGNKLFAFDGQTGVKKWEFETGFGPEFGESAIFGPTIGPDGTVYLVSMDSKIYALDGQTGVKKWEFEMEGDVTLYPDGDNSPAPVSYTHLTLPTKA